MLISSYLQETLTPPFRPLSIMLGIVASVLRKFNLNIIPKAHHAKSFPIVATWNPSVRELSLCSASTPYKAQRQRLAFSRLSDLMLFGSDQ
jgi:hypothetical protein